LLRLRALKIVGYFDEVVVGVADVDGAEFADGSGALDWSFFDVDSQSGEIFDHLFERIEGDEAEIGGAGCGMLGLGIEFVAALVEVDLLVAELERFASVEFDQIHAEDFGVEVDGCVEAGHGEDYVVDLFDGEGHEEE
jgi:hypothetical protein